MAQRFQFQFGFWHGMAVALFVMGGLLLALGQGSVRAQSCVPTNLPAPAAGEAAVKIAFANTCFAPQAGGPVVLRVIADQPVAARTMIEVWSGSTMLDQIVIEAGQQVGQRQYGQLQVGDTARLGLVFGPQLAQVAQPDEAQIVGSVPTLPPCNAYPLPGDPPCDPTLPPVKPRPEPKPGQNGPRVWLPMLAR